MAINRTAPLEERIQNIRADIDAFIDARVEAERKACPGVPGPVLRNIITARGGGCQCSVYLNLTKQDDAA
jgi:hypothetical protein